MESVGGPGIERVATTSNWRRREKRIHHPDIRIIADEWEMADLRTQLYAQVDTVVPDG
jgi:hypothetical protein